MNPTAESSVSTGRRRASVATIATLLALAATTVFVSGASAAWPRGGTLLSILPGQPPATNASQLPSISAEGDHVVFLSRAADLDASAPQGGIFRKNRNSGAVDLVAKRFSATGCGTSAGVGGRPWVSGNGRFVAFETAEPLVAADTNGGRDVYLRDMNIAIGSPGAYELVSALDGGQSAASYAGATCLVGSRLTDSARAISSDGTKIVFSTDVNTNLPDGGATDTARTQVFVRDVASDTTHVATTTIDDPLTAAVETAGLPIVIPEESAPPLPRITISGTGSVVAWSGAELRQQTPFHAAESESAGTGNEVGYLWQRLADIGDKPARRVTGQVDLDDPNCDPSNAAADIEDYAPNAGAPTDPCLGPLAQREYDQAYCVALPAPGLDHTGNKVAFTTCAELRHAGPRPGSATPEDPSDDGPFLAVNMYGEDVFLTDMSPGVTRKAGTRELTRSAGNTNQADLGGARIHRVDLAANGDRIALVTGRAAFTLPSPTPTGSFPTTKDRDRGFVISNLKTPSTADDMIEWATRSHANDASEDLDDSIAHEISLDGKGESLVFSSLATDVFFGDGNGVADVFVNDGNPGPAYGPSVSISSPTQGQTFTSGSVSVAYATQDATEVTCSLDGEAAAPCAASPIQLSGLAVGAHTYAISVSDGSLSNTVVRNFSVTQPQQPPPPPPTTPGGPIAPAAATLSLGKATTLKTGVAKLTATVSAAGKLTVTGSAKLPKGKKLKAAPAGSGSATSGAAGDVMLSFKLNAKAKKQLKKKKRLAVQATVTFTPASGASVARTVTLSFKAK